MKPYAVLVAFVAALVGGVVGALLGGGFEGSPGSAPKSDAHRAAVPLEDAPLRSPESATSEDLRDIRNRMDALALRLTKAENEREELAKANKGLASELDELRSTPAPEGKSIKDAPDIQAEVDRAIEEALEKAREKEKTEKIAANMKGIEAKMHEASERAVGDLEERLGLTDTQRERVSAAMGAMVQRYMEIAADADEAKRTGSDFDWGAHWTELMTDTESAIRHELSSAQLGTFDELINEVGLAGILWPEK